VAADSEDSPSKIHGPLQVRFRQRCLKGI